MHSPSRFISFTSDVSNMLSTVLVIAGGLIVVYAVVTIVRTVFFPPEPVVIKPAEVGEITLAELDKYDGSDPFKPLLFAVRGVVFDVSEGRAFYGPGEVGGSRRR